MIFPTQAELAVMSFPEKLALIGQLLDEMREEDPEGFPERLKRLIKICEEDMAGEK